MDYLQGLLLFFLIYPSPYMCIYEMLSFIIIPLHLPDKLKTPQNLSVKISLTKSSLYFI